MVPGHRALSAPAVPQHDPKQPGTTSSLDVALGRGWGGQGLPKEGPRAGAHEPDGPVLHTLLRVPQVLQALMKVLLSPPAVLFHLEGP